MEDFFERNYQEEIEKQVNGIKPDEINLNIEDDNQNNNQAMAVKVPPEIDFDFEEHEEQFANKKLFVMELDNSAQMDTLEELVTIYFNEFYINKPEREKISLRYSCIYPFAMTQRKRIFVSLDEEMIDGMIQKVSDVDFEEGLFINNDVNFFLSMCKINELKICERMDSNIFTARLNKKNLQGDYVIVNDYAKELLKANLLG